MLFRSTGIYKFVVCVATSLKHAFVCQATHPYVYVGETPMLVRQEIGRGMFFWRHRCGAAAWANALPFVVFHPALIRQKHQSINILINCARCCAWVYTTRAQHVLGEFVYVCCLDAAPCRRRCNDASSLSIKFIPYDVHMYNVNCTFYKRDARSQVVFAYERNTRTYFVWWRQRRRQRWWWWLYVIDA